MWDSLPLLTLASTTTIVAFFAALGFNQPSWSRSYTTALRYRLAQMSHMLVYITAFLLLVAVLVRYREVFARADGLLLGLPMSTALVWIAACVVLAVRAAHPIARYVREVFHSWAQIPSCAQNFAQSLISSKLDAKPSAEAEARELLAARGIQADENGLPIVQAMIAQLMRATTLFLQLRCWETDPSMALFASEARNEIAILRRRFERLSFRISRGLASIGRLGEMRYLYVSSLETSAGKSADLDSLMRCIATDVIADCCADIDVFYDDACLLAARGAMATQRTRARRQSLVGGLGFQVSARQPKSYSILLHSASFIYVGLNCFFFILPAPESGLHLKSLILVIAIIMTGAMAIAILPKRHFGFANSGLHRRAPLRFIVWASLASLLFAVFVNLFAGALLMHGMSGALQRLSEGAPWLLGPCLTTATVAWLIQDHRWSRVRTEWGRRFRDAATLGGVWVLSSVIGTVLKSILSNTPIDPAGIPVALFGSFVFGGLLGLFVLESVRNNEALVPCPEPIAELPEFVPSLSRRLAT